MVHKIAENLGLPEIEKIIYIPTEASMPILEAKN